MAADMTPILKYVDDNAKLKVVDVMPFTMLHADVWVATIDWGMPVVPQP